MNERYTLEFRGLNGGWIPLASGLSWLALLRAVKLWAAPDGTWRAR